MEIGQHSQWVNVRTFRGAHRLIIDHVLVLVLYLVVSSLHLRNHTRPDRHLDQVPPGTVFGMVNFR